MGNNISITHLPIPKRHLLLRKTGGDDSADDIIYGTSHIREVLVYDIEYGNYDPSIYNPAAFLAKLDRITIKIGSDNRKLLVDAIESGATLSSKFEFPPYDSLSRNPSSILLSPYISKTVFRKLHPRYESIQRMIQSHTNEDDVSDEEKQAIADEILDFLKEAIHYKAGDIHNMQDIELYLDYAANNKYLVYLINLLNFNNGVTTIVERKDFWGSKKMVQTIKYPHENMNYGDDIKDFIKTVIHSIRSLYSTSIPLSNIFKGDDDHTLMLPSGFVLQRGTSYKMDPTDAEYKFHDNYSFFSTSINTTLDYITPWKDTVYESYNFCDNIGEIYVFLTTRPLKLLNFSDIRAISYIRLRLTELNAPLEVIKSFEKGWKINGDGFERESSLDDDIVVVKWLCDNGYDGYIATGLQSLADEIMLCNPRQTLTYMERYSIANFNVHVCEEPYWSSNILMSDMR
jgi:hypothetical protein